MLVREPPFPRGGRGVWGMGALIRTANQFQNSDFPTPRGYEQAVHPPFNNKSSEERTPSNSPSTNSPWQRRGDRGPTAEQ